MPQSTNLNITPYNDDFNPSNNYYRYLFAANTALQARELTGIQSMLQDQIEKQGSHQFKDGSIVSGGAISHIGQFDFVRFDDYFANNSGFSVDTVAGSIMESAATGLQAAVILGKAGAKANYPDTNRLYIRYLNSGANNEKTFANNEVINFYSDPRTANVIIATANTLQSNASVNTIGQGYGMSITDGVIYQKGFFIHVIPHTIVVSDYSTNPGNTIVGFDTVESIITADIDPSLNDNALGYSSYGAPGADRLKLVPTLTPYQPNEIANTENFAAIVTFNFGKPIQKQTDPAYAQLGDWLAKEKFEESGNFVVKPFTVDTVDNESNTSLIQARVSPGIGYAAGHRVELLQTAYVDIRRGIDVQNSEDQVITASYGNWVYANNVVGAFDFDTAADLAIYDTAQQAVYSLAFATISPVGNVIGYATVRGIETYPGTNSRVGTASNYVSLYLYNIRMNPGKSFSRDAKSVILTDGSGYKSIADLRVESGKVNLYESQQKSMVFSFGKNGVKKLASPTGNNNTQYIVRKSSNGTMAAANGTISLTISSSHSGGTDKFPYGVGLIGDGNELDFNIVALANVQSANLVGTVSGNTTSSNLTGTSTTFASHFSVGEYIKIDHTSTQEIRAVANVISNTVIVLDSPLGTVNAAAKYTKFFPAGYRFPMEDTMVGTRTINVLSPTSLLINTGTNAVGTLNASIPVRVHHNILRTDAVAAAKQINKNRFVKIDTSNNIGGTTGPWDLGLSDIHKIRHVYSGSSYANTNEDKLASVYFQSGQTDTHYDHGMLFLRPGNSVGSKLLVELDHFVPDTSAGIGFFSIDSYPIDDANTANTSAITTAEIPVFQSDSGTIYPLRDAIDFRPLKSNTANSSTTIGGATINPGSSNTFSVDADGLYVPAQGENFEADVQYYLGRKDLLYFSTEGQLNIKESQAADAPQTPQSPENGMAVAVLDIPPYPSISSTKAEELRADDAQSNQPIRDTSKKIKTSIMTNKRYTMRDISVLDDRLSKIEYYQALSLLEKAAADLQVPDENGLDRFKNGIFADPLNSHIFGDVANPEYRIAVDSDKGYARPYVATKSVDTQLNANGSTSVSSNNGIITLPYAHVKLIEQSLASKYRSAAPNAWSWRGQMFLYPCYNHAQNTRSAGQVQVNLDLASPWEQFANSPWGTNYGQWRTIAQNTTNQTQRVTNGNVATTINTQQNQTINARTNQKLNVSVNTTRYNLGQYVTDITVQPYLPEQIISFKATGMRPSTRVYAFFDNEAVSTNCAPGARNNAVNDLFNNAYVTRTGAWGSALRTDSSGIVYGQFRVPGNRFRVGDRQLKLLDIDNLTTGADAATTTASATFTGSSTSVTKQSITLTALTPEIHVDNWTEYTVATTTQTTTNVTIQSRPQDNGQTFGQSFRSNPGSDPIAQSVRISVPENVAGAFLTKIKLFFKRKSSHGNGVSVYLCEVNNGFPDKTKILPYSRCHLPPTSVSVSDNASVGTEFVFDGPVFVTNNKEYAFVIKPDGDDPDYLVWFAELGGTDVATRRAINSQPYVGVSYLSANESTWTPLQNEDIKFELYRANFTSQTGTVVFENQNDDFFKVSTVAYYGAYSGLAVGDLIYSATNLTNIATVNTAITGTVQEFNLLNNELWVDSSTGLFTPNTVIQFHRVANASSIAISNTTLVASATISSIDNPKLNAVCARFSNIIPPSTNMTFSYGGTSNTYVVDAQPIPIELETETELFDVERMIASRSNEKLYMSDVKSLKITGLLSTRSAYLSPLIDMRRRNVVAIHNLVDPTTANLAAEYTNSGTIQSKYLSKTITLEEGQDAEDLRVILTAVRPPSSDIIVYAKLLASEDPESITSKSWTRLTPRSSSLWSDASNVNDWKEFTFELPSVGDDTNSPPSTVAVKNPSDADGVVHYTSGSGSKYYGFKQFAIKWILLADSSARVPRVTDVMALALQL